MFVVVNRLHFSKPVFGFISLLKEEGSPFPARHKGIKDYPFVKTADDKAIVIIFWENAASAETGVKSFGSTWFVKNFNHSSLGQKIVKQGKC